MTQEKATTTTKKRRVIDMTIDETWLFYWPEQRCVLLFMDSTFNLSGQKITLSTFKANQCLRIMSPCHMLHYVFLILMIASRMCLESSWVWELPPKAANICIHSRFFLYNSVIIICLMFPVIFEYMTSWYLEVTYLKILVGAWFYPSVCLVYLKGKHCECNLHF